MIIKNKADEYESFLSDSSNYQGYCDRVVIPASAEEAADLLRQASRERMPITIAGGGTGLNGGRCPEGGTVISTSGLNKILAIDTASQYVIVEAGVILADLQKYLAAYGFFYPPDPTEQLCFVGGTIATNASGAKSFGFGPTRSFVAGLEVILPDGSRQNVERGQIKASDYIMTMQYEDGQRDIHVPRYNMPAVKNAAGYFAAPSADLIDLFIGAEGTLGIITKAKLEIRKLPERLISCLAFFGTETDGLEFIDRARSVSGLKRKPEETNKLNARALEYFDRRALAFLSPYYPQIPTAAGCAVWFEQQCTELDEQALLEAWMDLIERCSGAADTVWYGIDDQERERISGFRHAISTKVNEHIARGNFRKLGTDTAVPEASFVEFYFQAKSYVEQAGLDYVAYGHFGDCHLHLNMLPASDAQMETGKRIYTAICELAVKLGGSVSAEHGIGKSKRHLLELMYGAEAIAQMRRLKSDFDVNWILNRGNLFLPLY